MNDDEKAFNELFERYWARVYAVAYKYLRDEEASLEITHDIFLNIWNKRHQLHINSFKNYVTTAASYHGIRKRQTQKVIPLLYVENFGDVNDKSPDQHQQAAVNAGEANILTRELDIEVDALLNELPKRCREIYLLSRKNNLTIAEIATQLNISKRTVENQLTNALKHLRTSLQYAIAVFLMMNP